MWCSLSNFFQLNTLSFLCNLHYNVDYAAIKYTDGCDSFHEKSKKIFDASVTGSVLHQLCYENSFGHRDHIPVDCQLGVVVSGWSQGSHVASLAGNYAPSLITAGLFWGNGEFKFVFCIYIVLLRVTNYF